MSFLTRDQIESIVEGMTARDIFQAMPEGAVDIQKVKGAVIAGDAFEAAAERQGHGAGSLDRVRPGDAQFLSGLLSEAMNVGGPKADPGASLQPSASSGGSGRKRS